MSDSAIYSSITLESEMPDSDVLDSDTPEPELFDPGLAESIFAQEIDRVIREMWHLSDSDTPTSEQSDQDDEDDDPLADPELINSELNDFEGSMSELMTLPEDQDPELVDDELQDPELLDPELLDPELDELMADLALHEEIQREVRMAFLGDSEDSCSSETPEPDSSTHSHVLTTPTLSDSF